MAPLSKDLSQIICDPLDTGVHTSPRGDQYLALEDDFCNKAGGRPDERHGWQGGFTHGVTIFAGGVPHNTPPSKELNHGTVLGFFPDLKCDDSHELKMKEGTEDERQGRGYSFDYRPALHSDVCVENEELNHGIVLHTFTNLKPDLSYEGTTNVVGGRADERRGTRGGFTPGVRVWRGGAPRDIRPPQVITNRGTVIGFYPNLKCDDSHELQIKPGTDGERLGRGYAFNYKPSLRSNVPVVLDELNHGTVLYTSDTLKPDMTYEGNTNVVGGRADERLGKRGGYTSGVRLWCGGLPRDVALPRAISPGTVLYHTSTSAQ